MKTNANATARISHLIAGNVLTLQTNLAYAIAIGQGVWSGTQQQELTQRVQIGEFILDGVMMRVMNGDAAMYPDF